MLLRVHKEPALGSSALHIFAQQDQRGAWNLRLRTVHGAICREVLVTARVGEENPAGVVHD